MSRPAASGEAPGIVVFDLDGTLIDGYAAIGIALAYATERLGVARVPDERVRGMVGDGLELLLEKAVGPDLAGEGVRLYREKYPEVAVEESELLPGVPAVLETLARSGWRLAVASNKPAAYSRLILEAKGIAGRFDVIGGPDALVPPKPHPAMLAAILAATSFRPDDAFVVGDMEIDAQFARAAGCRVALVPGGSRTAEELATVDADALLPSLLALPAWLARERAARPAAAAAARALESPPR
ncbi:MAG: HAD family hydrolase [Acidobacteriota bacterium]